ncbi:MAG: extensin family protein [Pseudomonadota bacterium]
MTLVLALLASAACANAPSSSLRPEPRPVPGATVEDAVAAALGGDGPVAASLRPKARPGAASQGATRAVAQSTRGQICGDPALIGERMSPIPGRVAGCGVAAPVRVRSAAGIALSMPSTMDCNTAKALKTWINEGVKPAVGDLGGGVERLRVVAHYQCRTVNHRPGGRISEHGKGKAIDIAGIGLRDGSEITVETDWNKGRKGRALRNMWRAACGPFGTVLGPEADVFHEDHFHFDTAARRSRAYCR